MSTAVPQEDPAVCRVPPPGGLSQQDAPALEENLPALTPARVGPEPATPAVVGSGSRADLFYRFV